MSTDYIITDHFIAGINCPDNQPVGLPCYPTQPGNVYYQGEAVYSWVKGMNMKESGQIRRVLFLDDKIIGQTDSPISYNNYFCTNGYCTFGVGWPHVSFTGLFRVDVYLKANSDPDWKYYFSDSALVYENPSVSPEADVYHAPKKLDSMFSQYIYDNEDAWLNMFCSDNSNKVVSRQLYWNDGSGWQVNSDTGVFGCNNTGYSILAKMIDGVWDREASGVNLGNFPEDSIIQYYLKATDFSGNVGQSETKSFTVLDSDTEGPEITNLTIEEGEGADMDGFIDETEPTRITWQATDQSGIAEMLFHLNGQEQTVEVDGDLYTVQFGPQSLGEQSYVITATDADSSPETSLTSGSFEVFRKAFVLNPSLDAADDGQLDWNYEGEMEDDQITGNFADAINQYIGSNDPETDGKVLVPLRIQAEGGNMLKVQDLSLLYRITDTTPPTISDMILTPESPHAGENVSIGATVYDNTGIKEVTADFGKDPVVMIGGENDAYSGSLTAPTAGQYELTIRAKDLSDLESVSILPFATKYDGAELSVESVQFTPVSPLLVGEQVVADVTIKNTGNQAAETEVQLNHVITETQTVSVPAGSKVQISTTFTLPSAGQHSFEVNVDPNDLIAEGDETNNEFIKNYQVADGTPLAFEALNIPTQVGMNQSFEIQAKLADNTELQSLTANWLGQIYDFELTADDWYTISLIAPDSLGAEALTIMAKGNNEVTNEVQELINIVDATPNPYVSPDDITSADGNILALENPEFSIVVHNDGGSDVSVPIQIKLDGAKVYNEEHLLKAGQMEALSWSDWQATGGNHEITVTLDPENLIQESNESDNEAIYSFNVPYTLPPQLSNLQITEDPLENQPFEISVDVLGDQEISNVIIDINGSIHVMSSADGTNYGYSGLLPTGSYPFQISATNTSNLVARIPGTLTVHRNLADLKVQIPQITPINLTNEGTAQFTITVQNIGYQSAENVPVQIQLDGQEISSETVTLSPKSESALPSIAWPAISGNHELTITIDPENLVQEADENNNTSALSFNVGNVNPPNISNVETKEILYTNELFTIEADVEDQLTLEVTAELDGAIYAMNLDSLSNKYRAELAAPSVMGEHSLKVVAKNADGLSSEWQQAVTVLDSNPDLAISPADVTISPRNLIENQPETVSALIHNYGGSDLSQVQAQLKVNSTVVETKAISIQKGDTVPVSWEWLPVFGSSDLSIVLDPNNLISESSEINNQYAVSLLIRDVTAPSTPQLAMVGIQSMEWSETRDWKLSWPEVEESNLKSYAYQIDGGIWKDIGSDREVETHFDIPGEHKVCVVAEDLAGNTSSVACQSINLDFEAPEAPVLMGGTNGKWFSDPQRSIIWNSPLDDGSGPVKYRLTINDEDLELVGQNHFQQIWEDGQYTVKVSALDVLDHQSEMSNKVQLFIDATAPEPIQNINSPTHPDPQVWQADNLPAFSWPEPEDLSGVQGYYYHIDQEPETEVDSRYQWTEKTQVSLDENQTLQSGQWYLHVLPLDQAGNTGESTMHYGFKVDLEAPQTTVGQSNGLTVKLNALDPHSGVKQVYYAVEDANQLKTLAEADYNDFSWNTGDTIFFSVPGTYTLHFYAEDNLGNKEVVRTETITVNNETTSTDGGGGLSFNEPGGGYKPYGDAYYRYLESPKDEDDQNSWKFFDFYKFLTETLKKFEGVKWDIKASSL